MTSHNTDEHYALCLPVAPPMNLDAAHQPLRILVVEDYPAAQRMLRDGLEASGYSVHIVAEGAAAIISLQAESFDLILLDLMLPDVDGLAVCRAIRASRTTPIIVLSAVTQELQKVALLEAGADDYLTKPVGFGELRARIRAAVRRAHQSSFVPGTSTEQFEIGELIVDVALRQVTRNGVNVQLTPSEWTLLRILCRNAGQPVTNEMLAAELWPQDPKREPGPIHTLYCAASEKTGLANLDRDATGRRLPFARWCRQLPGLSHTPRRIPKS